LKEIRLSSLRRTLMNVSRNLERSAFFFPQSPALSQGKREISYQTLNESANRVATSLIKKGIKPGDFIGLCAPNSIDWVIFYFGVLKIGAVAVTFSSLLQENELQLLVDHSRPKIIFTTDDRLPALEKMKASGFLERIVCPQGDWNFIQLLEQGKETFRAVDRDRAEPAAVLYTGGTTGIPKGVLLTHENINVSSHNVAFSERSHEADRALCFLPFNHVFGQMHILNATILSTGCLEIMPAFELEKTLQIISLGKVTKFYAVPTIYTRLLTEENLKEKLGQVHYCFSAAASLAGETVRQWKEITGLTIYEGYGMTESASAVTYNHVCRHVIGSVGETVPGVEVEIRDLSGNILGCDQEGEICIRGRNIMPGYLNNPEDTQAVFWDNGWFRSGDIGLLDDQGYLYIVDRLKDMIITGGENVYPREVEELIYTRSEVQECAVIGLPDREWGERVTAFIIPKPERLIAPEELKSFLKTSLSSFKVPKEVVIVTEMPKSPTGKILKRELKKKMAELRP
jgi:long-chain acyl-CoA synthetase